VEGVGLRPLAYWDYCFESRRGHGYLSLENVVCCQVEVSATGRSPVQSSRTECGVSECDRESCDNKEAVLLLGAVACWELIINAFPPGQVLK
jgi:hypothetical protein